MQDVLREGLERNSSCIFTKALFKQSFKLWDSATGNHMRKAATGHDTDIHDTEAGRLQMLFDEIKTRKKNMTTGVRTPDWLKNLIAMVDSDDIEIASPVHVSPQKPKPGEALVLRSPSPDVQPKRSKVKNPKFGKASPKALIGRSLLRELKVVASDPVSVASTTEYSTTVDGEEVV